jgi:CubicO group peptidase (beta-lactamase class C family)
MVLIKTALARSALAAIVAASAFGSNGLMAAEPTVGDIVRVNARSIVTSAQAPGVAVAILNGDGEPLFFTYGDAVVGAGGQPSIPFRPNMLFDIASNTKVFTTNLLGQRVATGALRLNQPLSDFSPQIGVVKPKMGRVTLKELGSFTGGIPTVAPICELPRTAGCMPSGRPSVDQYGPADMAAYFRSVPPKDFSESPPVRAQRLPAPYFYSNFSVAMLGLLMGGPSGQQLSNANVSGWYDAVDAAILKPLAMRDTVLTVPNRDADRRVMGYARATAQAVVENGAITGVRILREGANYSTAPEVAITGGGGSGASATAKVSGGGVGSISVTSGGQGYVAPPQVIFSDGDSTVMAQAEAIVVKGALIGVRVTAAGSGYQRAPTVTISGGRGAGGRDATATARISNGAVVHISLDDPGAGYVDPLTVAVAPGGSYANVVPAWAPAGGLKSSLRDMAKFAAAAMGRPRAEVPNELLEGFRIAQTPYACQGVTNPSTLSTCPAGATRSGLAWMVSPRDVANGVPKVVSKIGGLPGYSSTIAVMPKTGLGVVVFVNSFSSMDPESSSTVYRAAESILYALYFEKCGATSCSLSEDR